MMLFDVRLGVPSLTARPPLPILGPTVAPAAAAGDSATVSAAAGTPLTAPTPVATATSATAASAAPHRNILQVVAGLIGGAIHRVLGCTKAIADSLYFAVTNRITKARSDRFEKNDTFAGQPVPQIATPYVLVPGFSTPTTSYRDYLDFLTRNGANGGQPYYVKQGAIFTMDASGTLQPLTGGVPKDARIFEMIWSDPRQNPDLNLPELTVNMQAITQATNCPKVDVEAYSMGGLDVRLYRDGGGPGINRLLFLGVPNHGTRSADIEIETDRYHLGLLKKVGGVQAHDGPSMQWLKMNDNPRLDGLNHRYPAQVAGIPTLCVGTDAIPTVGIAGWKRHAGDGIVEVTSLAMPNTPLELIHDPIEHGRLNKDGNLVPIRARHFGWTYPTAAPPAP